MDTIHGYAEHMGTPIAPSTPVLMVALLPLKQWSQAGPLPPVAPGHAFWANSRQVSVLISAGQARLWVNGDPPVPQAEPPHTAYGVPGLGTGVTNNSH
jgi:hypothetical protein